MRLDLDSEFQCDFNQDPFEKFYCKEIKYGFILSYFEASFIIPTLWNKIKEWTKQSSIKINKNKVGIKFISDDNGNSLN